jgi:hypothetical protein
VTIHDVAQGTRAWMTLRAGIPTASCFDRIITSSGKKSASREGYMNHLLAERILNQPLDTFQSADMAHGNEFEAQAVASYEFQQGCDTKQVGFVTNFDGMVGCSPDRFIVQHPEGALECKCPKPATHVSYLLASLGAGKEYKVQLQGQILVCELEWIDILSYAPGMPQALYRVHRDEEFIKELSAHVLSFARELEEKSSEFAEKGWIKPIVEEELAEPYMTEADLEWALNRSYE